MTGRHRRTEDDEGRRLYEWHTVDFHPASAAGWLVLALDDEGHVSYQRLPGWLVQEQVAYSFTPAAGFFAVVSTPASRGRCCAPVRRTAARI